MPPGYLQKKAPRLTGQTVPGFNVLSLDGSRLDTGTVGTAQLADGAITSAKIADGTIATVDLANGAVTTTKMDPALLQGFHVEVGADILKVAPSTALVFSAASFGGEQWADTSHLSLGYACRMHIHAQVAFRDGDSPVLPGARAQLVLKDGGGSIAAAGLVCEARMTSDGIAQVEAVLSEHVILREGTARQYHLEFLGQCADGTTPVTWAVKASNLSVSPPVAGSFCEGTVIPRPSGG